MVGQPDNRTTHEFGDVEKLLARTAALMSQNYRAHKPEDEGQSGDRLRYRFNVEVVDLRALFVLTEFLGDKVLALTANRIKSRPDFGINEGLREADEQEVALLPEMIKLDLHQAP